MADPNLAALTSFKLKSAICTLTTTSNTTLFVNAAASGQVLEIYAALVPNIDGAAAVRVTLDVLKSGAGAGGAIVSGMLVNVNTTEIAVEKDYPIVLQEGDVLRGSATANGDAQLLLSYREYSAS